MKSKLNKEYKQRFSQLRTIINSWDLIPGSPSDEFDSLNNLFLSQLYKGIKEVEIVKVIYFELTTNYGFSIEKDEVQKMTEEVLNWWMNLKN